MQYPYRSGPRIEEVVAGFVVGCVISGIIIIIITFVHFVIKFW